MVAVVAESVQQARDAAKRVYDALYDPRGGVIAQCQFGPGGNRQHFEASVKIVDIEHRHTLADRFVRVECGCAVRGGDCIESGG